MSEANQRRGGCQCGAVRYTLVGEPAWVAHCHCRDCRRATGALVATYAGYREDTVKFEQGEPSNYESSPGARRGFCSRCGSSICYASHRWPGELHMLVAGFDDPSQLRPQVHVYVKDRLPWHHIGDGLPQFLTVPSDAANATPGSD